MNNLQENYHFNRTINTIAKVPEKFPLHWHKYVEVIALPPDTVVKKSPVLRIHQTEYRLHPGDMIFIWSGELHEMIDHEDNCLIGMQFEASYITDLPEFASFINLFRSVHHIRHEEMPALAEGMMQYLQHIFSLQEGSGTFRGIEALISLLEMFIVFGEYLKKEFARRTEQAVPGVSKIAEKMHNTCSYISDNCDQDLNLDAVADHVGFSSCYFSRAFKQATTYNFVEYLTIQRVKRAQALLADSNVSITEVSYQSGFKSISTFNRVFRQYKGCSPSDYRKYYLVQE